VLETWVENMRALLAQFATQAIGYPMARHEVRPPAKNADAVPEQLRLMYAAFDGADIPDIHVGYWIHSAEFFESAIARNLPDQLVVGDSTRRIQIFARDGGGGKFAIDIDDGAVYYLPSSMGFQKGQWGRDECIRARRIASSVQDFLALLIDDVQAFIRGERGHEYLAQ
jgi:hypothetical protein